MPCAACGIKIYEKAHVRPKRTFGEDDNDTLNNIIHLCPNHHIIFDKGKIGICRNKQSFIIKEGGELQMKEIHGSINNIKLKYIRDRNERCDYQIKYRLGLFSTTHRGEWCKG